MTTMLKAAPSDWTWDAAAMRDVRNLPALLRPRADSAAEA
jgi:hypothetical protein